jgi:hypothetical protein
MLIWWTANDTENVNQIIKRKRKEKEKMFTIIWETCPAHALPSAVGMATLPEKQLLPPRQSQVTEFKGSINRSNLTQN